jgi:hypothetical protein
MKSKILVPQQVPEFIQAEYPAFIEFLKAYYEWLDTEVSLGKIEDLVDLDSTLDGFLQYFRKQLDVYGITTATDDRQILKNIKQLYTAKGSTAGFEFLFRILFNKSSSVVQPWEFVFIPSNGNWVQDTSILVTPVNGDVSLLVGNSAVIRDEENRNYRIFVKNLVERADGTVELFVSRFAPQSKLIEIQSIQTLNADVECEVLTSTVRSQVQSGGTGFKVGQVFPITSNGDSGSLCKVKSVDNKGTIKTVEIIRFGAGYTQDFSVELVPTGDVFGDIIPTPATIKFFVGQFCVYPGYYRDSNNIVGDLVFIQDSYYYQVYSYVTVLEQALADYRKILREVLHPAGTAHFATHQLNNNFSLNISVDPSLNIITKEDALRSFVSTLENIIFAISSVLNTTVSATDELDRTVSYIRDLTDQTSEISDAIQFASQSVRTDSFTVTDVIDLVPGIEIKLSVQTLSAIVQIVVDKYLSDGVSTSNGPSGLYMAPYYVEPLPPYWQAGYLENERAFTN